MRTHLYRAINVVYWIAIGTTTVLTLASNSNLLMLSGNADILIPVFKWLKIHAWWSIFTSIAVGVLAVIKKNIVAPWAKQAVKHILDKMRDHAFASAPNPAVYHHRVTLFRHVKGFCWQAAWQGQYPFGGWLVPFARSGHVTQKIRACFRAPDDASLAEGIGGSAFVEDLVVQAENLPDIGREINSTTALELYASVTLVTVEWLKKFPQKARSFIGIPVKVKGQPWGVIVVDSRSPKIANIESIIDSYKLIAAVLGLILERS